MKSKKLKKQPLPELLSAVCNHKDCPNWLAGEIWDALNESVTASPYSPSYFRFLIENAPQGDKCPLCGKRTTNENGMHEACKTKAEMACVSNLGRLRRTEPSRDLYGGLLAETAEAEIEADK